MDFNNNNSNSIPSKRVDYIVQKTERLAAALNLISDLYHSSDPYKWRLRSKGLELLDCITSVASSDLFISSAMAGKLSRVAGEVVSLINIGKSTGIVSEMNHKILLQEIDQYSNDVESLSTAGGQSLFEIKDSTDEGVSSGKYIGQPLSKGQLSYKRHVPYERKSAIASDGSNKTSGGGRSELILGIVKTMKEVGIKDIAGKVAGVSEKTIQRELSALVGAGKLKKTGERRWSRYSLI